MSQLACFDDKYGWYTTNVVPAMIKTLLADSAVPRGFLSLFCQEGVWETLEAVYHNEPLRGHEDALSTLQQQGMVNDGTLTMRGLTCYVVLGHLAFNMVKKIDIDKAIQISKIIFNATGINYGEFLPFDRDAFQALLANHPDYEQLSQCGVSPEDMFEYLRQNNVPYEEECLG